MNMELLSVDDKIKYDQTSISRFGCFFECTTEI